MHDYLRAIGFSSIHNKKDMEHLVQLVLARPDSEFDAPRCGQMAAFGEKTREFLPHTGIAVRGEIDDSGRFMYEYDFPYITGQQLSLVHDISLEKMADREDYTGVGYDVTSYGVSLVFHMNRLRDYTDSIAFLRENQSRDGETVVMEHLPIALSALSISGTVLLPLERRQKKEDVGGGDERSRMIAAARRGDQSAIENLTLEDIDMYALISKRLKNEDIKDLNLSIANQNLAIKRQQNVIAKGTVVSELDGIIQTVDISEESIAGGQPAIVISAEGSYSARVSVDEFSLDEMEIGEEVSILSYDTGSTYYGKVSKKSEAPSNDGYSYYEYTASSYPVTIVIEGGEDLSEGMWVEVTRNSDVSWGEKSNEIVLPLAFCKKEKGSYYVMKREGDRLKKQYISTGKIYWGQYIVVKSGLKPDDFIAFPYAKDAVEGKVCKEADISDLYGY